MLFLIPVVTVAQTSPPLGISASYALFTTSGAISNSGLSQVTGDFGTNGGAISGFGNVNGQMHTADATTTQCAIDVANAYNNLTAQTPAVPHGDALGGGEVLSPNIYLITTASTITGNLILDGCGDPNAQYVFQLNGVLSTAASSRIVLTNGTKACNVFWRVAGAMNMATNTTFKGTIIASGAVTIAAGCSLEGRALSTAGAFVLSSLTAAVPLGCNDPVFSGPVAPNLGTVECFSILTSNGIVTNTGTTNVIGDIGSNSLTASGFNPIGVVGLIHPIPDAVTAQASLDLSSLYATLSGLPYDIELLNPVLFGKSQVLTPNIYLLSAATMLSDTLFLDARGVLDAVFVIRIMGALTTNVNPQIVLLGGAQASNVFWQVEGAVTISGGDFNGIIVANNGAIVLNAGVVLDGRALSTTGNITTQNVTITSTNTVGVGSSIPTLCINTELTAITHKTTGATGIGAGMGLPAGVTATWSANALTINGIPTTLGTFNYSIPLTGGCGSVNATGTITVTSVGVGNTGGAASSTPTICINTALTNITHTTTSATGIGSATGLPGGVTAAWLSNTITISGTPTASGTFNYSIPLTGGCGSVNVTGTITVTSIIANTVVTFPTPTLCLNTAFSYISHSTEGATGIGSAWGLPTGLTAAWSANTITISGTPTVAGTYNYSIQLTGGCGCINATGVITISPSAKPVVSLITTSKTACHGVKATLGGNVTATGAWTLTLSDGQTTTGSGSGAWSLVVAPTTSTTYTIASFVDAATCLGTLSGSTTLTLPTTGTTVSNNNESATCELNKAGWIHFYHSSGRLIASINSAGQNLGDVSVTSYLDVTNQVIKDCYNPSAFYETEVMRRHWVIAPSIQPVTPVLVRLPFKNEELTFLSGVANANLNLLDDVNTIADIKLSKYSGPLNVDSIFANNCTSEGGNEGTTIHTQVSTGLTTDFSTVAGSQYTDFSISRFSELWLHGSSVNSPLPIELLSFTATTKSNYIELNWVTASEINNDYFDVERSLDGINFTSISTINGAGNSIKNLSYSTIDYAPLRGWSYYRLKQTDYDGKTSYSNIVTEKFIKLNDFKIYPNPNSGEVFYCQISNNDAKVLVVLRDMMGHEYYSKVLVTNQNGEDLYSIDPSQKLDPGTYSVTATSNNKVYQKKLVVINN